MKKSELRQVLKPLIKECIKEVIFEEGVLSNLIKEVAVGIGSQQTIVETRAPEPPGKCGSLALFGAASHRAPRIPRPPRMDAIDVRQELLHRRSTPAWA